MGYTLTEKILREHHAMDGSYEARAKRYIKIDQTLTQDATGTHGLSPACPWGYLISPLSS